MRNLCKHTDIKQIGGFDIDPGAVCYLTLEWCKNCGAQRLVIIHPAKYSGYGKEIRRKDKWKSPRIARA